MEHLTDDQIVDLALGENPGGMSTSAFDHVGSCAHCSAELAAYRHVIGLAHEARAEQSDRHHPAPGDWTAIALELGFSTPPGPVVSSPAPESRAPAARVGARRTGWMVAAAIAALLAIGGGVLIGRATVSAPPPAASSAGSARLTPLPGDAAPSTGSATVNESGQGETLTVSTHQLPLRQGFYQVWLYDQTADKMVPIGTLNGQGTGSFTLSPSIDIKAYNIVDVSAQELNGDPAHGTSVLRGILTQ